MFDGPEHESYVALMRDLRLEREFEVGDWAYEIITRDGSRGRRRLMTRENIAVYPATEENMFWLPRLDQWWPMLWMVDGDADTDGFALVGSSKGPGWVLAFLPPFENPKYGEAAPSAEEALARLWRAVTGRTVEG